MTIINHDKDRATVHDRIEQVRAAIAAAKASNDPAATINAVEAVFEFFVAHDHEYTKDSHDDYVGSYTVRTSTIEG